MANQALVSSPHRHGGPSVAGVMARVCAALLPALAVYTLLFGPAILIQALLATTAALATEYLALWLRGRPLPAFPGDVSVVVTALLFALCVSPFSPWWVTVAGILFAVAVAKHAFGGLGQNPFNPAMAGYVFVLLCFPAQMNVWPTVAEGASSPGLGDSARIIFAADGATVDAYSGASPLNHLKSRLGAMEMVSEIRADPVFGHVSGRGWEWVSLCYLAGGLGLLALGIIRWHIPVAMLASLFLAGAAMYFVDGDTFAPPLFHLFTGSTMLGAFFIATDPVTAATSDRGRLLYGALVGLLAYGIRTWGAYPDGVAFAILLANAAAPLIDRYSAPPVLGEQR